MDFLDELQLQLTDLINNVNRLGAAIKDVDFAVLKYEYKYLTSDPAWNRSKILRLDEYQGMYFLKRNTRDSPKEEDSGGFMERLTKPLSGAISKAKPKKDEDKEREKKDEEERESSDLSNFGPKNTTASSSTSDEEIDDLSSSSVCPFCDVTWEEFEEELSQDFAVKAANFCKNVDEKVKVAKSNADKLKEMMENLREIKKLMDGNMQYISIGSRGSISQTYKMARAAREVNDATHEVLKTYFCAFPPIYKRDSTDSPFEESRSFPSAFAS